MNRGILIAIEGIDGAGKTTQLELLATFFRSVGETVVTSKEPTNGPWGQKIRTSAASGRMSLDEELHAFVEDRKEHVRDLIGPALTSRKFVILDRYFYSTIAYQGSRGGNVAAIAESMRLIAPEPDAVVLIDVPAEVGVARVCHRDEKANHFEGIDNLRAVRDAFLRMPRAENIAIIDGSPSTEVVRVAILKSLVFGVLARLHTAKHWGCVDPTRCLDNNDGCHWAAMVQQLNSLR